MMKADNNSNKRHRIKDRKPCNLEVVLNDSEICKAFDIGEGGIYVYTSKCRNIGSVVNITLQFTDEKLEIMSKIKHCHQGVGMGLMFIDLDDVSKAKIKEAIDNIPK
jgi:hypothetical protein